MAEVYCGIDIGTSNVKVLFLDDAGKIVGRAERATPRVADSCIDADALLALIETMIVSVFTGGSVADPLRAVCVAGVGEDGVPLDVSGHPLDLAIPWFDGRARAEAIDLRQSGLWSDERVGVALDESRTAAKWSWLAKHRPDIVARAAGWSALTDYPAFFWSGRAFMSETLAARTACYDVYDRVWSVMKTVAAGAPPLPNVVAAGTLVGPLVSATLASANAIDGRTVVVAGGHDHPLAASVVRGQEPTAIVDSLGTAELIYAEIGIPVTPESNDYFAFSPPPFGRSTLACLGVFEFSNNVQRFRNETGRTGAALRVALEGAVVPGEVGSGGARFVPSHGSCAAKMLGAVTATPVDRARAILEGCAMYARRTIEAAFELGAPGGSIYTTGGWTNSSALLGLRASALGSPLGVLRETQLTALGAALTAARACGNDLLSHGWRFETTTIDADPTTKERYDALYAEYRALFDGRGAG